MTKVGIVDDEIIICETIKKHLEDLGYKVNDYCLNYEEGIDFLKKQSPDIMLLDINLKGEKSGIDLAKYIRQHYNIPVVFISSYSDKKTIEQVKEIKANGYLLKPFTKNDLFTSIEIAISNFYDYNTNQQKENSTQLKSSENHLFLKQDQLFIKLNFSDILYIKSEGVYAEFVTSDKKYLIRETMKAILDILPTKFFIQSHRSYIVNISHINAVHHEYVLIKNENIPVGKSHKDLLLKALNLM